MAPTATTTQNTLSASADALDDDFELDNNLIAYDDGDDEDLDVGVVEGSSSSSSRVNGKRSKNAKAGPPSRSGPRVLKSISVEEEDEFALDDDEDVVMGNEEEEDSSNLEQEVDEYGLPVGRSSKRARLSEDSDTQRNAARTSKGPSNHAPLSAEEKKRRRKEKQKEAKRQKMRAIDEAEAETETSFIALQPPALQADYMAEMQSQAMPKLSSIEMEDFRILERYFLDTTSLEDRKSLKGFVQAATKYTETNLKSESLAQPGSPKLLVVSGAALRVTDVVRDLRDLTGKKGGEVAKLFAKHFKLAEHCKYCEKTKFGVGAGTPDRVLKLIEADALKLDELTHLVLDMKKDAKKRNLLDIPESRTAVFKLLATPRVNDKLKAGLLKLVMY